MTGVQTCALPILGAVLNSKLTCELIADKIHVHPELFRILLKIKGTDKLVLITDAIRGGCLKDGIYELGGQQVFVNEGRVQLSDGRLAGSVLTLNQGIKNFKEYTSAPLNEIIKLVSLNPARVIGIEQEKGSIEIGKDADIVVFDDEIEVKMVFVEGNEKWRVSDARVI